MTAKGPPPATPRRGETGVLHISDLHFGLRFVPEKWDELQQMAASLAPDLVIVSGDVVETPWRWRLRRARVQMLRFRDELRRATGKPELRMLCVAGNHDTRLQGVFPVRWLLGVALACVLLLVASAWPLWSLGASWPWVETHAERLATLPAWQWIPIAALAVATVLAFGLRLCVTGRLASALGPELTADRPMPLDALGVGVVPFDSSTPSLSWARGRVSRHDMVACKRAIDEHRRDPARPALFWIAVVHHHPLPLPYDDAFERMMVMDNAGSFLSELSSRGVRLVLHGHKHHQHFARVMIDPLAAERIEVSVLSAGTATRGRTSLVHRHGFNFLQIDPEGRVRIRMFEAEGDGTFNEKKRFDMVPAGEQARWLHEQRRATCPLSARTMTCVADVNVYGDAHFIREFRGVEARLEQVAGIETPFVAHSESGFVEAYRAASMSAHGPGVMLESERVSLNEMEAKLFFKSSGLRREHGPVDFVVEFQNNNSFALDRWQFRQMYPDRHDFCEDVQFRMPVDVAVEELILFVRFDASLALPRRIDLRCKPAGSAEWLSIEHGRIVRIERQGVVQAHLVHPKTDAVYQLVWDLEEPADTPDELAAGRALRLRRSLAARIGGRPGEDLHAALEESGKEIIAALDASDAAPLQASLFAYEEETHTLACIASTHARNDPRASARYAFGLGIAGRAFKASDTVAFVRPHNESRVQWTGYITGDGRAPEDATGVLEESMIAFALHPVDAPDWPYAVLQFSSDEPAHPLAGAILRDDNVIDVAARGLCETLTDFLERRIAAA